jgi:hypothetical protein
LRTRGCSGYVLVRKRLPARPGPPAPALSSDALLSRELV